MTMIVIAIVAAIAVVTLAMIVVPGMAAAVFRGVGLAFFQTLAENRAKRIAQRAAAGLFGRKKRRREKLEDNYENPLDSGEDVAHHSDVEESDPAPIDADHLRETLKQRIRERRERRLFGRNT